MAKYGYNVFTGRFDRLGDSGGGGGNITISGDSGPPLNGDSFSFVGQEAGASNTPVMDVDTSTGDVVYANNTWWTPYVVDASTVPGLKGTYQTIQSAIDAAVIDGASVLNLKMIYIRPGTYVENLTIPPGIFLKGNSVIENSSQILSTPQITGQHVVLTENIFRAEGIFFITADPTADLFTNNPVNVFIFRDCVISLGNSSGVVFTLNYDNQSFYNCIFYMISGQTCMRFTDNANVIFDNCIFPSQGNIEANALLRFWNCSQIGEVICDNGSVIAKDSIFNGSTNCISGNGASCSYRNCQFNSSNSASVHTGQQFFSGCSVNTGGDSGLYDAGNPIAQLTPSNSGNIFVTHLISGNTTADIATAAYEIDSSAGPVTITLPSVFPADILWIFKDAVGSAAINPITIQVQSATGLIDDAATLVINKDFGGVSIKGATDGVNYLSMSDCKLSSGAGGDLTLNLDNSTSVTGNPIALVGATAHISDASPFKQTLILEQGGQAKVANLTFLSPYVVDPSSTFGLAGTFTTIQAAIDAAIANGAIITNGLCQTIWIRPGNYVENPVIPDLALLNFVGQSVAGAINSNSSDVIISGNVTFTPTTGIIAYFENICFYPTDNDALVIPTGIASLSLKNCTLINGNSGNCINITGNSGAFRAFGCAFLGPNVDSSASNSQPAQFTQCYFTSTSTLSNVSSWRLDGCLSTPIIANDEAEVQMNNTTVLGGIPYVYGTTTGAVLLNGVQGTGAGASAPAAALIDTSGDMFATSVAFKALDDTNPMNPIFGVNGVVKMLPNLAGNIINSKQVAANYTMIYYDTYVGVTSTASARTISLPSNPVPNGQYIVKDESLSAGTNNITVNVDGATGTIDGLTTRVINTNAGCLTFKADQDGVNYFTI